MNNVRLLIFLSLFSFHILGNVKASESEDVEYKNMEQMLSAVRLEKKQVELMLDKMVTSGRISADDGVKVKRELASVKDEDLEQIKKQAIAEVKSKRLLDH